MKGNLILNCLVLVQQRNFSVSCFVYLDMIIYSKKSNTTDYKEFVIPKNESFNSKTVVLIKIDLINKKFEARKMQHFTLNDQQWEETQKFSFPGSIFDEYFL